MTDDPRSRLYPTEPPLGSDREVEFRRRRSFLRRHAAPLLTLLVVVVVLAGGIAAVVATWDAGSPPPEAFSSAGVDAPLSASPGASGAPTGAAGAAGSPSAGAPSASGSSSRTVVLGTIVTVANGSWAFRTDQNFTLTVVLTPTTKYGKNNNPAPFVAGVHVRIIGMLNNQVLTATSVARAAA